MIVMLPTFCGNYGIKGIWMAAFHSVSAFCNAGFDILGTAENKYPSLTGYIGNPAINITIMLLIIVGGIGFLTWDDIYTNKWHFKKYRMQSKVILVTTAILIIAPAVFFSSAILRGCRSPKGFLRRFFSLSHREPQVSIPLIFPL